MQRGLAGVGSMDGVCRKGWGWWRKPKEQRQSAVTGAQRLSANDDTGASALNVRAPACTPCTNGLQHSSFSTLTGASPVQCDAHLQVTGSWHFLWV